MRPAGTAWSPTAGLSAPGLSYVAGYQAGTVQCSGGSDTGPDGSALGGIREDGPVLDRPPPSSIPDAPGSYQFKDRDGRVIYVGKAKSLRSRVGSYFARPDTLHQRTRQMVETAAAVEWIEVRNEVEALFLEHNLIQRQIGRAHV